MFLVHALRILGSLLEELLYGAVAVAGVLAALLALVLLATA